MSEPKAVTPGRDEKGRILPGFSLNDRRLRNADEQAFALALRDHYHPQKLIEMIDETWGDATPKVRVQLIGYLLPYLGGKPATVHHRISTKFEDMLAALGSNEPVTIEGQVSEDSTKE